MRTAQTGRTGRSSRQMKQFKRYGVDGLEIKDAEHAILVTIRPEHIASAKRGDPQHCVIAEAFRDQHGATTVFINRTVAYVDLTDIDGVRKLMRFSVPPRTFRVVIEAFDLTANVLGTQVWLMPPAPSDTLDRRAHYNRNRKRDGKAEYAKAKRRKRTMAPLTASLRNGSGMHPHGQVIEVKE